MEQLGTVMARLADQTTGSLTRSKTRPVGTPTTIEECRELREWAETTSDTRPQPATVEEIRRHLAFVASTLPSKTVSDEGGRKRFAVYVSLLAQYSEPAIAHMARLACERLRWFPVPAECLELIAEYRPPSDDRASILRLCDDTAQGLFERWLANIGEGQPIGDVSDRWLRIAVERGTLRRLEHDRYVTRALYHHHPIRRA